METMQKEQWHKKYIGDEIKIRGHRYMVSANYPKDGYLLAFPINGQLFNKASLKVRYTASI
ncbi:hypothetical protein [Marinicellulosiphila megalodicopiae]|uniref:hypothetical protein n=1 Tax=Marinicellulosiphila megalodicopiae TaxID=2724896 RepID=UPI003BB01BFE